MNAQSEHVWAALARAHNRALNHIEHALKEAGLPPLEWYDVLWELEQAAAEKEAKRAARKRAAAAKALDAGGDDPIKAAIERAQARKAAQETSPASAGDAAREKIQRIEARLEKARAKLAADDGSDATITAALTKAVETTEKKLTTARAELDAANDPKEQTP